MRLYESLSKGSVVRPCVAADDVLDEFIGEYGAKLGLVETQEMGKGEVRDTTFETARRALVQVGFEEVRRGSMRGERRQRGAKRRAGNTTIVSDELVVEIALSMNSSLRSSLRMRDDTRS